MNATKPGYVLVSDLLGATMEPTAEPDAILAEARAHDGKTLTKRNLDRLNAALPGADFRIHQIAGMTSIEWGGYGGRRNRTDHGGSVLVAYAEKGVTLNAAWIKEHNEGFYAARDERNATRRALLADPDALMDLGRTIDRLIELRREFASTYALLTAKAAHGEPWGVVRCDLDRLIGIGNKHDAQPADRVLVLGCD